MGAKKTKDMEKEEKKLVKLQSLEELKKLRMLKLNKLNTNIELVSKMANKQLETDLIDKMKIFIGSKE